MKTLLRPITTLENRSGAWARIALAMFAMALFLTGTAMPAAAQTAGEAAITGTVTDSSGAVVSNAKVTATNVDTGVSTSRKTTSAGVFEVSPLIAGTYTVTVEASTFEKFVQDDVELHENQIFGLNPVLKVGGANQTVTVKRSRLTTT